MSYGIGLGVDWDWQLLEGLIQERGDCVIYETGLACPRCRKEDTIASFNDRNPNETIRIREVNCPNCHGYGFIYRNAIQIKGLLTQVNAGNRQLIDAGIAMPGDCTFSPTMDAPEIQDMDRITLCITDVLHEGQIIQRGAAHSSNAQLRPTDLETNEDRLWYFGSGEVVWCEDANNVPYAANVDFRVVDNKVEWIGNAPAVGTFYTIKYHYYPEWIAYSSPLQRVDRGRSLGIRCVLRKKHVAYTTATAVATPSQRQTEQLALTGRLKF